MTHLGKLAVAALLAAAAACGGSGDADIAPPPGEVRAVLAGVDFGVGANRLAFALVDETSGPIRDAEVSVSSFRLSDDGVGEEVETAGAVYRRWPVGPGGVYTTELSFDAQGVWGVTATAVDADGMTRISEPVRIEVSQTTRTPPVGSPAPRSVSKTSRDVASLDELTTDIDPDPELYSASIADALDSNVPLLVSFATPAFCQTATCGPQIDVIKELKDEYGDRAGFIHVEVYDNPHEIHGDLTNATVSPTVLEWRLPSEPWTFIVDAEGVIRAKFEAFATKEELETALLDVIG